MPNIGLCFQTTWNYLNDSTEEKYRKVVEALKAAKSIDGGKEIRLPMNYAKDK